MSAAGSTDLHASRSKSHLLKGQEPAQPCIARWCVREDEGCGNGDACIPQVLKVSRGHRSSTAHRETPWKQLPHLLARRGQWFPGLPAGLEVTSRQVLLHSQQAAEYAS